MSAQGSLSCIFQQFATKPSQFDVILRI